jgi:hypothetical protein
LWKRDEGHESVHTMYAYMSNGTLAQDKTKRYQALLVHLQSCFQAEGLRKVKEDLYRRVFVGSDKKTKTVAWEPFKPIDKYMNECLRGNLNMWSISTGGDSFYNALRYFKDRDDIFLQPLVRCKGVFSFNNGVYVVCTSMVKGLDDYLRHREPFRSLYEGKENGAWIDHFHPYPLVSDHPLLQPGAVAPAKHFPFDFPEDDYKRCTEVGAEETAWRTIDSSVFSKIFTDQKVDEAALEFTHALFGRWFLNSGAKDNWQALPWIVGYAGTGKSTLCKLMRYYFEEEDVGVLSNNVETKFGLSEVLAEKFAFVAPEIRGNVSMDFAELLSAVIPGEKVSLAVKNKSPKKIFVTATGLICGNSMIDNVPPASVEAVSRRAIVFLFHTKVENQNADLDKTLEAESPRTMLKAVHALRYWLKHHGRSNLWTHIPEYFQKNKLQIEGLSDPLRSFLTSGMVVFGEEKAMKMIDFKRLFTRYCKENHLKAYTLSEGNYGAVFFTQKLESEQRGVLGQEETWIRGVEASPNSLAEEERD